MLTDIREGLEETTPCEGNAVWDSDTEWDAEPEESKYESIFTHTHTHTYIVYVYTLYVSKYA